MKLPCEMVQDLLPLYHDGVCSEVSRTAVQAHLAGCEECRKTLDGIETEIAVPKLEMDAAKPLLSIQVNWEKQTRKEKWKYIGCGAAAFFLAVTLWWGLTHWCIVPLKAEDYIIKAVEQLENGVIHIEYSLMYDIAYPNEGVTEDGILYDYRTRPILAERRKQIPNGSIGCYFDPDDLTWFEGKEFHSFCLGKPGDEESMQLWSVGMELPPASLATEEQYKQMEEAYAMPNAPEWPERVIVMEPERISEDNGNVQETVVAGSGE